MRPEPPPFDKAFDPNQRRDARGRWASGGGADGAQGIRQAIAHAIGPQDGRNHRSSLGPVKNADHIREATGIDIAGFERTIDSNDVRHALKSHGDAEVEANRRPPQKALTPADIALVPTVIASAHTVEARVATKKHPASIRYIARISGNELTYVENVRTARRQVAFKSMWKR